MKNISLAYSIPVKLTKRVGVERFKVYMNMENPFMIYKLAPRVMVEKQDGSSVQRFRYGSEITTNTESLNNLAQDLASHGFAVPR